MMRPTSSARKAHSYAPFPNYLGETSVALTKLRNKHQVADTNKDGVITFAEWARSTAPLSLELKRLISRWSAFDVEGKGYLTKEEAYYRKD